jgi:hypothetical protein
VIVYCSLDDLRLRGFKDSTRVSSSCEFEWDFKNRGDLIVSLGSV